MLKSSVGALAVVPEWLAGEDNRSIWAVVGVLGKNSWEKFKLDSAVCQASPNLSNDSPCFSSFYLWFHQLNELVPLTQRFSSLRNF